MLKEITKATINELSITPEEIDKVKDELGTESVGMAVLTIKRRILSGETPMKVTILSGYDRTEAVKAAHLKVREAGGLDKMKVVHLKEILKCLVPGTSKMRKAELVAALNDILTQETYTEEPVKLESVKWDMSDNGWEQTYKTLCSRVLQIVLSGGDTYTSQIVEFVAQVGSDWLKQYAPQTIRTKGSKWRSMFKSETLRQMPQISFNGRCFESDDESIARRINMAYSLIYSGLKGLYTAEYQVKKAKYERDVQIKQSNQTLVQWDSLHKLLRAGDEILRNPQAKKKCYRDAVLWLCLMTGRRVNEVLSSVSEYRSHPTNPRVMYFKGQSKGHDIDQVLEIPVLCDSHLIIQMLDKLQKWGKMMSPKPGQTLENHRNDIHNRHSKELSKRVKDLLPGNHKVHDLRKIYAAVCVRFIRDSEATVSEASYVASICGHGSIDPETGLYLPCSNVAAVYSQYKVTGYPLTN